MVAGFFLRRALFLGIHIEMMGLVGNQDGFMGLEILKGHGIFLGRPQIRTKSLGGGKAELMASGLASWKFSTCRMGTRQPSSTTSCANRYLDEAGLVKFSRVFSTMLERLTKNKKFR